VAETRERITDGAPESAPARRSGRWARCAVVGYVVAVIVAQVVLHGAVAIGRRFSDDPRTELSGVPNFRIVDADVWAGGQPYDEGTYRKLADAGVRLVVDLRTGAPDDRNEADPVLLRSLGVDYLRLPVRDGHVPSGSQVDRFVEAVQRADGVVLLHCGAGVGRSSSFSAAYARRVGEGVEVGEQLSLGAHTFEQLWYVSTGDTNMVVRRVSEALDAPRRGWSRLREAF
jgi:protein tyrosine phosphatase (PTP) superfamily phosphohydrolase (DUF442 family)